MRFAYLLLAVVLLGHASAAAEESASPPEVSVSKPRLSGGKVDGLEDALQKTLDGVAACVATHGGLSGDAGRIEVQFLVRERGRAEGVEVARTQKVTDAAADCVQKLLKQRPIGKASDDPVGVFYAYKLKRR